MQRYYYYIHNGIDTEHVAPMEDSWLENVLGLVSEELKVFTTGTYCMSLKKKHVTSTTGIRTVFICIYVY